METFASLYAKINIRNEKRFVYHLGYDSGFFSEYNNMILAMVYCMLNDLRFSIYSADANFGYSKGWTDYFLPFCDEYGTFLHSWFNRRPYRRFKNDKLVKVDDWITRLYSQMTPGVYTTFDLWNEIRGLDPQKVYELPEYNLSGDIRSIGNRLIDYTWRYNNETDLEIQSLIQTLSLPDKYVSFHIRGGDKFIEASILPVDQYIRKAEDLTTLRSAFVLTDDYGVIKELRKKYSNWTFSTFCQEDESGYFHTQFNNKSSGYKRSKYIRFFASIEALAQSQLFVGTFSSNPGIYLGMRMPVGKSVSIDSAWGW